MELTLNEKWIQFAFINAKGKLNKTALKIPCLSALKLNEEYEMTFDSQRYTFSCENVEQVNNNDGTYDEVYVVATNNQ